MNPFFTMNPEALIGFIKAAKHSILLIAPGVTNDVSNALVAVYKKGVRETIITRITEESFRQGYGDFSAVIQLQKESISLYDSSTIDIGLLIIDEKVAFVFTPVPRVIVNIPDSPMSQNAMVHQGSWVKEYYNSVIEKTKSVDAGIEPVPDSTSVTIIGNDPSIQTTLFEEDNITSLIPGVAISIIKKPDDIILKDIETSIKQNPIQSFDLTKSLSVYQNNFQYIDVKFVNCKPELHTVRLDESLVIKDYPQEIKSRFEAVFKVFSQEDLEEKDLPMDEIVNSFNQLKNDYIKSIPKRGNVFLIKDKQKIIEQIGTLNTQIVDNKSSIETTLYNKAKKAIETIIESLTPETILAYRKKRTNKRVFSDDEIIEDMKYDLRKALSEKITDMVSNTRISYYFKDITFEDIKDPEFTEQLKKRFDKLDWDSIKCVIEEKAVKAKQG